MAQERRSLDTRTKILEVAENEFAREGFAGAHLQNIASQVGVQKTALYYYFPSKAALYTAVLERMLLAFDQAVSGAVDRADSHEGRVERLLDAINDLLAENRNYSQILIRIFVDRVRMDLRPIQPIIGRVIGRVMALFREGVDAGTFRRLSARNFFQSLLGIVVFHYAARDFSAMVLGVEDIFTRSSVAWRRDEVRELVLEGILSETSAARRTRTGS
jgi:AcrR family transcriptional regulator